MSNVLESVELADHLDTVVTVIVARDEEERWEWMSAEAGDHGPTAYHAANKINSWDHQARNLAGQHAHAIGREVAIGPYRRTEAGDMVIFEFPIDCPHMRTMVTLPFQPGWSTSWKWSK